MEQTGIFSAQYKLSPGNSDFQLNLRPGAFFAYYIGAAWQHAEKLGIGYSHLETENLAWVLRQVEVEFPLPIQWPGEIIIETWPKGIQRFFYLRDALFYTSNNEIAARLTSNWMIIDKTRKRPKIYAKENKSLYENENKHALQNQHFEDKGLELNNMGYSVVYSDIDMNQHLTTSRYIDLLFDTFSLQFLKENTLKKMSVEFLKEVKFKEKIQLRQFRNKGQYFFEMCNNASQVCFKGYLVFESL
jgi:acyl-ACP thioesterase